MADGKVCAKCGTALSGQDIIGGKAKLVGGQLMCAACAAGRAAAPATSPAARPSGPAATAAQRPAPKKEDAPLALPPDEPAPAKITTHAGEPKAAAESPIGLGAGGEEPESVGIVASNTMGSGARHEIKYKRDPSKTGTGATRVRTFDTKLTRATLMAMDEQINAWLDETGYEVKFVSNTIGEIQGKTTEAHLIVSLWY
jgi:hypothetical protein